MARKAVLFIDLLGVQKMWLQGGANKVKDRIKEFSDFIVQQLNWLPGQLHGEGDYTVLLAGDSVSVMCKDYEQAIGIGIHFFTQAFFASDKWSSPFWLRGAIAKWSNQYLAVNTVPISTKGGQIGTMYLSERDHLDVLALEKSGFRGMRLIIDPNLLADGGAGHKRMWSGFRTPLYIMTRLTECTYPAGGQHVDVLWMADDEKRFNILRGIMAKRFKNSTCDPDEFVQASWTRAVFDQVDTLVWACLNK